MTTDPYADPQTEPSILSDRELEDLYEAVDSRDRNFNLAIGKSLRTTRHRPSPALGYFRPFTFGKGQTR